jgi:quercetin dioxygenase-like cupin family protein
MIRLNRRPLVRALKLATAAVTLGALVDGAAAQAPDAGATPKFVAFGKTAPVTPVALWTEDGKPNVLRGPEAKNAPPSATVIESVFYNLDGPSYRRVIFPKGAHFSPPSNPASDTILYVLKGRVEVKLGDEAAVTVGPNDAFRERAGTITKFHALERSELVETSIPAAAPK